MTMTESGAAARGRRRAVQLVAGGVVVALLTVGLIVIVGPGRGPQRPVEERPLGLTARADLGARPLRRPVAAYRAFWSITQGRRADGSVGGPLVLARVDDRTMRATLIDLPMEPQAVGAGFGSIWTVGCAGPTPSPYGPCQGGTVFRVDPALGRVTGSIMVGGALYPVAAGLSGIWTARHVEGQPAAVIEIDPSTMGVTRTFSTTSIARGKVNGVHDLVVGAGAVWLLYGSNWRLVRLDPSSGRFVDRGLPGDLLAVGQGTIWVNGAGGLGRNRLWKIDPSSGRPQWSVESAGFGYAAIGFDALWLTRPVRDSSSDPGIQVRRFALDGVATSFETAFSLPFGPSRGERWGIGGPVDTPAVGDGALWITDEFAHQVIRVSTSVFTPSLPTGHLPQPTITHIDLGGIPTRGRVAVDGALWIIVQDRKTEKTRIVRVDPKTGTVQRVPFGRATPLWLAFGFETIWVVGCPHESPAGGCPDGTLYRVDPLTMRVMDQIRIGGDLTAPATGEGAIWLGAHVYVNNVQVSGELIRVDPVTLRIRRYSLDALRAKRPPCCVRRVVAGYGAIWMTFGEGGRVIRLDPLTGEFTRLDAYGSDMTIGEGAVWVSGRRTPLGPFSVDLLRVDPAANGVVTIGSKVSAAAAGGGIVWVARASVDPNDRVITIDRLDPRSGRSVAPSLEVVAGPALVNYEGGPFFSELLNLSFGEGTVWLTVADALEAIRLPPGAAGN